VLDIDERENGGGLIVLAVSRCDGHRRLFHARVAAPVKRRDRTDESEITPKKLQSRNMPHGGTGIEAQPDSLREGRFPTK